MQHPERPAAFLDTPLADAASLALFAGLAAGLADLMWLLPPAARAALAIGGAALGPLGCGIERGRARRLSWAGAGLAGALAAAVHALAVSWLELRLPLPVAASATLVLLLGVATARLGARLDRGEAGWRAAVREGPPDGTSPLARGIAYRRLPAPLRWLLLPVDLPLRAALLLAILAYQLTFSRLMPPACRFEPTCSRYGFEALWCHGAVRGTLLTAVRLVRCSPLSSGGYDPVPRLPGRSSACPGGEVSSSPVAQGTPPAEQAALGPGLTPGASIQEGRA